MIVLRQFGVVQMGYSNADLRWQAFNTERHRPFSLSMTSFRQPGIFFRPERERGLANVQRNAAYEYLREKNGGVQHDAD